MLRRTAIARRVERDEFGYFVEVWRIVEADGRLCVNWAPGLEWDGELPLDRGGFAERSDALAFKLGVDRWRAEQGQLSETVEDIDAERRELDQAAIDYHADRQPPDPEALLTFAPEVMDRRAAPAGQR